MKKNSCFDVCSADDRKKNYRTCNITVFDLWEEGNKEKLKRYSSVSLRVMLDAEADT